MVQGETEANWLKRWAKLCHCQGLKGKGSKVNADDLVGFIRTRLSSDLKTPGWEKPNKGTLADAEAGKPSLLLEAFKLIGCPDLMKEAAGGSAGAGRRRSPTSDDSCASDSWAASICLGRAQASASVRVAAG
jgi:hypothetical protein